MQQTSVPPWQTCYYYHHIPKQFSTNHSLHFPKNNHTLTLNSTHSSHHQEHENHKNSSYPDQNFHSLAKNKRPHQKTGSKIGPLTHWGVLSNRWWASFKAALGQRINVEGVACFVGILYKERYLAMPHVYVPDIRYIDWDELKRRGFQGVVFDKDNTITVPYSLELWSPLGSSVERCKSLFRDNVAVFSNSAGLHEYDPDGRKAQLLERAIGIKVIRHRVKKPAGTAEEIERQFDCESSRLIMVGDRPFTDIIYGNRNGFLTILTEPLSPSKESFVVQQVQAMEFAIGTCARLRCQCCTPKCGPYVDFAYTPKAFCTGLPFYGKDT